MASVFVARVSIAPAPTGAMRVRRSVARINSGQALDEHVDVMRTKSRGRSDLEKLELPVSNESVQRRSRDGKQLDHLLDREELGRWWHFWAFLSSYVTP
jgi:hypothetical protein